MYKIKQLSLDKEKFYQLHDYVIKKIFYKKRESDKKRLDKLKLYLPFRVIYNIEAKVFYTVATGLDISKEISYAILSWDGHQTINIIFCSETIAVIPETTLDELLYWY